MSDAVLLTGAEIQFHDLYARFAAFSFARADEFDSAIAAALQQLGEFPQSAPEFVEPYRRMVLRKFSLALYYVIEKRRVFVHAILDSRSSPNTIRRHLGIPPI